MPSRWAKALRGEGFVVCHEFVPLVVRSLQFAVTSQFTFHLSQLAFRCFHLIPLPWPLPNPDSYREGGESVTSPLGTKYPRGFCFMKPSSCLLRGSSCNNLDNKFLRKLILSMEFVSYFTKDDNLIGILSNLKSHNGYLTTLIFIISDGG